MSRRLRPWLLSQLHSGRFPGLQWDDPERRALRIPWARAGRGGGGAGAALCRAWAEFKGRAGPGSPADPSGWKCRLRCALHRSPEFQQLRGRGRTDGPRPYRVYRLLPPATPRTKPPRRKAGTKGATPPPSAEQEAEPEPRDPGQAPPPAPLRLQVVIDSPEPLPPPEGPTAVLLRLFQGGALSWQGRLPPGDFLLLLGAPPPRLPACPPPPLPRVIVQPLPPQPLPPPLRGAMGGGVLLGSAPRGLFLRRRGARWGEGGQGGVGQGGVGQSDVGQGGVGQSDVGQGGVGQGGVGQGGVGQGGVGQADVGLQWRGPLGAGGALQGEQLVLAFDAQKFREAVGQHRAGRGPRPECHVTLAVGQELGPHDGPHNRPLVLQLEQAFARELLDGASAGAP